MGTAGKILAALATIIFTLYEILVFFWWTHAMPESAPQQSAAAAETLVLAFIPYAIFSTWQRYLKR